MSSNIEGFEYENTVIKALKEAGYCGNITEGAGASAATPAHRQGSVGTVGRF